MRILLTLLRLLLAFVALLVIGSFLLPNARHVERSVEVATTPDKVWPFIADPRQWPLWSPWYAKDPAMKLTYSGAPSGTGAEWSWESATQGRGHMRFDKAEPPTQLDYTLVFEDMDSKASGQVKLEASGQGTRVTWTFDTSMGNNPVMRWVGLGMDKMVGGDFEDGLRRLASIAAK